MGEVLSRYQVKEAFKRYQERVFGSGSNKLKRRMTIT
jgi:hypothetical protein